MTAVDVRLLVAGSTRQLGRLARRHGPWRTVRFPATVAVVTHPTAGTLLYDTGYAPRYRQVTRRLPERLYRLLLPASLAPGEGLVDQLTARGTSPSEVTTVVVSHLHADHSSGLADIPAARIVAAAAEDVPGPGHRAHGAAARRTTARGVLPEALPPDYAARRVDAASLPLLDTGLGGALAEGYDVVGDGSVVVVPLPGHSPGHLGLWLPETQGPPLLLIGDACWDLAALDGDLPPDPVLRTMHDPAAYVATVTALADLARRRPEVLVVPSHDDLTVRAATTALGG